MDLPYISKTSLLSKLLERGDQIAIVDGELIIEPVSKKEVSEEWLIKNKNRLIREILELTEIDGYIYNSYTTGSYSVGNGILKDGITLVFENLLTCDNIRVIYNVLLKRKRNTNCGKAGAQLPNGHFRVKSGYTFCKWWKSLGIPLPRRLSSFHDYMGKLKDLVFACELDASTSRVANKMIPLLTITHDQLLTQLITPLNPTDNPRTTYGQPSDNCQTTITDKEFPLPQPHQGLGSNQITCPTKCELSKQGNTDTRSYIFPLSSISKKVQDQTVDEWLSHLGPMD